MTKNNYLTTRRSVVLGGIATVTLGPFAAYGGEKEGKTKIDTTGLPEISMGNPKAPITVIEYYSLTCPACRRFHEVVLPVLKKKYIDPGHVKFVLREFPRNNLDMAAFMIARCAEKKKSGRFKPFVTDLFAKQDEWTRDRGTRLFKMSEALGFNEESFGKCLSDKELETNLIKVRTHAINTLGVNSTPTVFINGQKVEGVQSPAVYEKIIASLLSGKK